MPTKMREPSLLQRGAVYSLSTMPLGNARPSTDRSRTRLPLRARDADPREQRVVLLLHAARLVAAQHGEVRAVAAPRELIEVGLRGVQRARLAARRIEQIHAVAEAVGGLDGVREQLAGVVELELVDVADVAHDARRHVAHDEIGAAGGCAAAAAPAATAAAASAAGVVAAAGRLSLPRAIVSRPRTSTMPRWGSRPFRPSRG